MKRTLLIFVIGLAFTFKLEAKKVEGLIFFEKDTVKVTFEIPVSFFSEEVDYQKLQYKVKYYGTDGKKIVLKPEQAKEIQFKDGYQEIRMLSRENTLGGGNIFFGSSNIFLKLEMDGSIKMFKYFYTQTSPGMTVGGGGMAGGTIMVGGGSYNVEKFVLQKGNSELKRPRGLFFRKDMIEYFSDCPELAKKIENKDYTSDDLDAIVRYYNSQCGK